MDNHPELPFVMLHETHPSLVSQGVNSACLYVLDRNGLVYDDGINISPASQILSVHSMMPVDDDHGGRLNRLILGNADNMYFVIHISLRTGAKSGAQLFMKRSEIGTSRNLFHFAHLLRDYTQTHGTVPTPDTMPEYRETLRDLRARQISDDPRAVLAHITAITTAILKACQPITVADLTMLMRVLGLADSMIAKCFQVLPVDANARFAATDK